MTEAAVEKHVTRIFHKLGLGPTTTEHRRVLAVLTYVQRLASELAGHRDLGGDQRAAAVRALYVQAAAERRQAVAHAEQPPAVGSRTARAVVADLHVQPPAADRGRH